MIHHLLVHIF